MNELVNWEGMVERLTEEIDWLTESVQENPDEYDLGEVYYYYHVLRLLREVALSCLE